jgi:hypothetical protein|tara:strand:- start:158 stop:469 length:312 start_codon:yes stop_codon:yes gene_type:complete
MPNRSKQKGNRFERECVGMAKEKDLKAQRAWGSDGRSLGEHEEVDLLINKHKAQCKVRKRIAKWLKPSEEVDIQIVKEDRGEVYVIQKYEDWLEREKLLLVQT